MGCDIHLLLWTTTGVQLATGKCEFFKKGVNVRGGGGKGLGKGEGGGDRKRDEME